MVDHSPSCPVLFKCRRKTGKQVVNTQMPISFCDVKYWIQHHMFPASWRKMLAVLCQFCKFFWLILHSWRKSNPTQFLVPWKGKMGPPHPLPHHPLPCMEQGNKGLPIGLVHLWQWSESAYCGADVSMRQQYADICFAPELPPGSFPSKQRPIMSLSHE